MIWLISVAVILVVVLVVLLILGAIAAWPFV